MKIYGASIGIHLELLFAWMLADKGPAAGHPMRQWLLSPLRID